MSGYAQYKLTKEKYNARLGLRYEHTFESVKYAEHSERDFHKDYGNLVPSGSVGYNITPTSNLGLTYTMRISRPGISQLNPYVNRSIPTSLTYGNPSLAVAKSHNVTLAYNFFTPKLMLNASLSQTTSATRLRATSLSTPTTSTTAPTPTMARAATPT